MFLPTLATIALFFSVSSAVFAQSTSKSPFEDSLVKEFCDAFTKSSAKINKDNFTTEVGFMILPLFTKYKDDMQREWNLDISDEKQLEEASEKIGKLGALGCPAFMEYIKNNLADLQNDMDETVKTYNGNFLRVEGAPFAYLVVQNKAGKSEKIYWMEFFEGADRLSGNKASLASKPVTIQYKEMDVYDAVAKEYRMIKVAVKLEFK